MRTSNYVNFFYCLVIMTFSFFNCVDEQEDNSAPSNTFLANYGDTVWERPNGEFLRVVDNTHNPFETFAAVGDPYYCLDSYQNFTQGPYWFTDLEILENSENRLMVSYNDISDPDNVSPEHLEFTVAENTLIIRWNFSESSEDNWELMLSDIIFWSYEPGCGW